MGWAHLLSFAFGHLRWWAPRSPAANFSGGSEPFFSSENSPCWVFYETRFSNYAIVSMITDTPYQDEFSLLRDFKGATLLHSRLSMTIYIPTVPFRQSFRKGSGTSGRYSRRKFYRALAKKKRIWNIQRAYRLSIHSYPKMLLWFIEKKEKPYLPQTWNCLFVRLPELSEKAEAIKTDLIQYSLIEASKLPGEMRKIFQLPLYRRFYSCWNSRQTSYLGSHRKNSKSQLPSAGWGKSQQKRVISLAVLSVFYLPAHFYKIHLYRFYLY